MLLETSDHYLPKILIDNWNGAYIGYACYEYEDTLQWNSEGIYLNDKLVAGHDLKYLQRTLNKWKTQDSQISAIGYINYNFKNILYPHLNFKNKKDNLPY